MTKANPGDLVERLIHAAGGFAPPGPNAGILGDDNLDRQRGDALMAHHATPLPEPVIYYLRALEARYLDMRHAENRRALREVGWTFALTEGPDHAG